MLSTARVRAPELEGAGGLIDTAVSLALASQRGRVVAACRLAESSSTVPFTLEPGGLARLTLE